MNLKFDLLETIKIPQLHKDLKGIILSIWIGEQGIQYKVRYFWECKPQEVYFYEWELEKEDINV
ncbi:MAG: hypothetical protein V1901_04320 [Patescibacteria group bacterium]